MTQQRIDTRTMTREEWLEARRKGIGGSDAAAIVGLNPYSSRFTLWADKTGRLAPIEDNEAMRLGRDLESYVAERFQEHMEASGTPRKAYRHPDMLVSPDYPWAIANIDRRIVGERAGLECKTTSMLNTQQYRNGEFPPRFLVQCLHYLAVTGWDRWYLAVLILNREFMVFTIERSEWEDDIRALMEAEQEFWERHVVPDIAPEPDGSDNAAASLSEVYLGGTGLSIEAPHLRDNVAELISVKRKIKELKEQESLLSQHIKAELKDAEFARAGEYELTYKSSDRSTLNKKKLVARYPDLDFSECYSVSPVRTLRIKGEGEEDGSN